MSTIDYQKYGMEDAKADLNQIKFRIASRRNDPALPSSVGGGKTVNKMEELAKIYIDLYTHVEELVNNTILFVDKAKAAMDSADRKAASGISK